MKVINIVLSILILLLSAVAAVFSYFLFEKRSQFVTGWGKMATAIHNSAAQLDSGSGTKVASELTPAALAHENYEKLDSLVGKLSAQAASVINERNYLARALLTVNNQVGNASKNITANSLQSVDSYKGNVDFVVQGVRRTINNRNRSFDAVVNLSRRLFSVTIDKNGLIAGDVKALDPLEKRLAQIDSQRRAYDRFIGGLCNKFQIRDAGRLDAVGKINKLEASIRQFEKAYAMRGAEINKYKGIKASLEKKVASNEKTIAWQRREISDRDNQITSFQRAFGLSESRTDTTPWLAGSVEARKVFSAKVVSVNEKYGYFAFDAGKYSVVQQPIGNRVLEVNPKIEPGLALLVVRRNGDSDEFIARVQVSQVGETSSVANIPLDAKAVKVGDVVTIAVEEAPKAAPAATPAKKNGKR